MIRYGKARFRQEKIGRPIADRIYREVLGEVDIFRDNDRLDMELGVDAVLILGNGLRLMGQEKFLSHAYSSFRSMTVEHLQNWRTGEEGDWFKLACQFYFVGYLTEDETDFYPWMMANWVSMVLATIRNEITWTDNRNRDGRARASFRYTIMDDLPDYCRIASKL